ncbi:unnamed protein product [Protopolystoma xenopodis]|uniref:Secreted protein n=1 Tax=Protopolystoma xenopodis TaxID=117903 RepID=A0A448W9V5_9PLAT|nr:unnamed protein product [Protopolystoma xenopodis]
MTWHVLFFLASFLDVVPALAPNFTSSIADMLSCRLEPLLPHSCHSTLDRPIAYTPTLDTGSFLGRAEKRNRHIYFIIRMI